MNRITFIKRLVLGTAAVPAVLAASKATKAKSLMDYKPTRAYSLRNLNLSDIPYDPMVAHYDQSGNGNHIFLKPEDAPLYRSI